MTGPRATLTVAASLVVVALAALTVFAGCSATGDRAASPDQVTVSLGGYSFGGTSNLLAHPDFTANASSPTWEGEGYGDFLGQQMTMAFAAGGLVAGVKTLKATLTIPGKDQFIGWLAQDTLGNIHYLQTKDASAPTHKQGVALGEPPWFWLPRAADLAPNFTWHQSKSGANKREDVILSVTANWRGTSGLVWLREILDKNGDGVFKPKWRGPDERHDLYFNPATHTVQGLVLAATGGYVYAP